MKIITDDKKIEEILSRGVKEIINKESLIKKLKSGRRLRIKYGADPSAPDLHLGHSVCLWKLKELQDLGHQIVFIVGDFTAMIGDPSGRLKARSELLKSEIEENAKTYFKQVGKILDVKKAEIIGNSQWFSKMSFEDFLKLAGKFTTARILERDDFAKRMKQGIDIRLYEIFYPVMQAYDSVKIKADIELGGADQKFNMLTGRDLQKKIGQSFQDIITVPLLVGLDGNKKMSKSLKNYIGIIDLPNQQYGKIMSISDKLIVDYFELATRIPIKETEKIKNNLKENKLNPKDAKARLARGIVEMYHGGKSALLAEKEFEKVFKDKQLPSEIPKVKIEEENLSILDLLIKTKIISSKSEAKRLILQKGVKMNGIIQDDWQEVIKIKKGTVIQVGKRRFVKIV